MKLLFDQNLSPRLVEELLPVFPGCKHVRELGLQRAGDEAVWDFARDNGFAIVGWSHNVGPGEGGEPQLSRTNLRWPLREMPDSAL